jgi:hypothetical protein
VTQLPFRQPLEHILELERELQTRDCAGAVGGGTYSPVMTEWSAIVEAIGVALAGDRDGGREILADCWKGTAVRDAAQRCVLAHYLADVQDALDDEVAWDEAALTAFADVAETELTPIGIRSARALEPSLRLNLGDGYRRQGRLEDARVQADAGEAVTHLLPDDGHGQMISTGLARLQARLVSSSDE